MRLKDQVVPIAQAPAAAVPSAQLDEINRSIEFVIPAGVFHTLPGGIQDHMGSGSQQGLHPVIVCPDEAEAILRVPMEQGRLHCPPLFLFSARKLRSRRVLWRRVGRRGEEAVWRG